MDLAISLLPSGEAYPTHIEVCETTINDDGVPFVNAYGTRQSRHGIPHPFRQSLLGRATVA